MSKPYDNYPLLEPAYEQIQPGVHAAFYATYPGLYVNIIQDIVKLVAKYPDPNRSNGMILAITAKIYGSCLDHKISIQSAPVRKLFDAALDTPNYDLAKEEIERIVLRLSYNKQLGEIEDERKRAGQMTATFLAAIPPLIFRKKLLGNDDNYHKTILTGVLMVASSTVTFFASDLLFYPSKTSYDTNWEWSGLGS